MKLQVDVELYDIAQEVLDIITKDGDIELLCDAEITRQFETIQGEVENACKQYLKELFDKFVLESGEGTVGKERAMREQYGANLKKAEDIRDGWSR